MALQETSLTAEKDFNFSSIWGHKGYGAASLGAVGKSGGLISMWNPKKFNKTLVIEDKNFLVITGSLVEDGFVINLVNVYAP